MQNAESDQLTMCPVRGWWCGVSIIGVIVTNNIVTSYCDGEGNWPCLQHECQQMPGLYASVIFHLVNGVTIGLIDSYSSPNKIHHGHRCAADIDTAQQKWWLYHETWSLPFITNWSIFHFFIIDKCPPTFVFVTSNVLIPVLFVRHPFLYRYSGVGNNK